MKERHFPPPTVPLVEGLRRGVRDRRGQGKSGGPRPQGVLPGDLQQGLMLTLDLQHKEPPPDDLKEHFAELRVYQERVADIIAVK